MLLWVRFCVLVFFYMTGRPPISTLFPYTTLFRSKMSIADVVAAVDRHGCRLVEITGGEPLLQDDVYPLMERLLEDGRTVMLETDRKSTRLNSSHTVISYAVFCLKKKKNRNNEHCT